MMRRFYFIFLIFLSFSSSLLAQTPSSDPASPDPAAAPVPELVDPISSDQTSRAMVVTAHPDATHAALEILQKGGNAVDAAVAAQWVLNVVEPQSSGIGGGGFFLYFDAKKRSVHAFDGREKAPFRAFPEMFLDEEGEPLRFYPERITGGLPVGVPGTLKLLKRVHSRFGSKKYTFEELFLPAIDLAKGGVKVSKHLAQAIQSEADRLKRFNASRQIFFHPSGEPLKEGDTFYQKDLAKTFETLIEKGISAFYEGEIARALVQAVQTAPVRPGLLQRMDLLFYQVVEREPLHGTYRGHDIFTMGPPSSGGVALLQIFNILENYSLVFFGASAHSFHMTIEAQKFAFEDRAKYLADPDLVKIPLGKILSKDYAKKKAKEIKSEEAREVESLVEEASLKAPGNTSHISIWDAEGNLVSYTTTLEHIFGSAMVVPEWGFVLNNELTDFEGEPRAPLKKLADSVAPQGTLIHSGLEKVKGKLKANAPAPEKRPRSSMTPVLVFRNGLPVLVAGSPGGSLIIPIVQEIVMYLIDFKLPPAQIMSAPRFAARGNRVEAEAAFMEDSEVMKELKKLGHRFVLRPPFGNAQAIFYDDATQSLIGVSDPRGDGEAKGY